MDVTCRQRNDTLMLDLHGPFPELREELESLENKIQEVLVGHSSRVVICLHNTGIVRAIQFGALIQACNMAKVHRISVVTRDEGLKTALSVSCIPTIPVFGTEEEAFQPQVRRRINAWTLLAIAVMCLIMVVALTRFLSN